MSTLAPSTPQLQLASDSIRPRGNRWAVMSVAFWHTLRRDIMVAAREFVPFIMQTLVQPFFNLLVFGRILPNVGAAQSIYPALFLPGVVALNVVIAGLQGVTLSLILDLSGAREIDDRLLAPMPVSLVAIEKIVFSSIRSLVAGAVTFPLAFLLLGGGYQVRTDMLLPLFGIMVLAAISSSALGLWIGAALPVDKIFLLFTILFSSLQFAGCVFFSWSSLSSFVPVQIVALLDPVTYASEGFRYAMVPPINGHPYPTLAVGWVVLGLCVSFVLAMILGLWAFRKRAIS